MADALTPETLTELLADAGDLDAGTEVLDALRLRTLDAGTVLRLQARLFTAPEGDRERRRAVLGALREGAVDLLARAGHLLEAAAAWRALARAFPEEPAWAEKLTRVEGLLAPLDPSGADPDRVETDAMIARGDLEAAWKRLNALQSEDPRDLWLAQRIDALQVVLFGPSSTKPYREGEEPPRDSLPEAAPQLGEGPAGASLPGAGQGAKPEVRIARTRVVRVGKT